LCHGWAFVFLGAHKLKKSHPAIGLRLAPEVDPALSLPKPFKDYRELVSRLKSKGMTIRDEDRAVRKLSQIGYYRLSGYWHVCRIPIVDSIGENVINKITNVPERKDEFFRGTSFDNIVTLYLFDKKLRLLLLDAIERVEIYIRTIIAHELGKIDSLAYKKEKFIAPKHLKNYERDG
jgi:abortive infection bacteriophage resistance protein